MTRGSSSWFSRVVGWRAGGLGPGTAGQEAGIHAALKAMQGL